MARKRSQTYLKGDFTHRRTEADYMGTLLDAVSLEDWRSIVNATVAAAKDGDAGARGWLAQYLMGRPGTTAQSPLTVVVQQLSGVDPVAEKLAKPHIDRLLYPSMYGDDDLREALQAKVAAELAALERRSLETSAIPEAAVPAGMSIEPMA